MATLGFWTMNEDLKAASLSDVLEKLEKGKIGHRAAMEWLNIKGYDALVELMHANGRPVPGHQPMRAGPKTRALLPDIPARHTAEVRTLFFVRSNVGTRLESAKLQLGSIVSRLPGSRGPLPRRRRRRSR